jgi:hypothetical protein
VSTRRGALLDAALLLATLLAVVWITCAYVSYERYFYFWDQAVYQSIAVRTAGAFRESFPTGWQALQNFFREDYNALFTLPLVPWLNVFGPSRLSYELGLAVLYLFPLVLCWGAVAAELVPGRAWLAFWAAAGLALLTPMTWVPMLRGYPDAAPAALIALALCLYLRDMELQDPVTVLMLGGFLALSAILRRHFAYAAIAFLVSVAARALAALVLASESLGVRVRRLAVQGLRLCLVLAVASLVSLVVARDYVRRLSAYDFPTLYRSYEQPLDTALGWYLAPYGWLAWILAAAGFGLGLASPRVHRSRARFVLLFGAVSGLQWWWRVRQIGEQYTLHFTPLIVLGWLLLCVACFDRLPRRLARPAVGILVGIALVNLFLGLTYPDRTGDLWIRPLFAARWAPLVRLDYAEMLRLVKFLRADSKAEEGVYVVASSACLNPDILRAADEVVAGPGPEPQRLNVLSTPLVDSDGFYPLGELLEARYAVVARPFQHHLPAQEQDVVKTVYDIFEARGELAQDWSELPGSYRLMGCTASVFRRRKPTPLPVALLSLARFQTDSGTRPGMQPDWVVVDSSHEAWLSRNADGSARLVAHIAPRGQSPSTTLAALVPLSDEMSVRGLVEFTDSRCSGATLAFATLGNDGAILPLSETRRLPGEDGHFEIRLRTHGAAHLLLSLLSYADGLSIYHCLLKVDSLSLRPVAPAPSPRAEAGAS